MIGMNRSFNMEPATATDVCDGIFKSKNITVHGNATITEQKGPKLVFFFGFFMDFILEENAHGLALKFSQNHGNLENYKHGTVK